MNKHNYPKIYKTAAMLLAGILIATLTIQLLMPISIKNTITTPSYEEIISNNYSENNNVSYKTKEPLHAFRSGLFKSAIGLNKNTLASKTIENILSQLKLQCIMTINGRLVAYIHVKGLGLKKCNVGDSVNDMFTVLNINKEKKCVDISIIDHKTTLYY